MTEHKWTTETGLEMTLTVETREVAEEITWERHVPAHTERVCRLTINTDKATAAIPAAARALAGTYAVDEPRYVERAKAEVLTVAKGALHVRIPTNVIEAVWGAERRAKAEKARKNDEWRRNERNWTRDYERANDYVRR